MEGFVKLVERLLGMEDHGDNPRADMFLPDWLLLFGLFLILAGAAVSIGGLFFKNIIVPVIGVGVFVLGILAILCWRNQSIRIISSTQFEYTTFMGNKKIFRFDEIREIRQNSDSMTMFVGDGKVHMESCALFTEELANKLDEALERINGI